ncbi:MAG: hypothetical protein P1Q69_10365 [Candidatus Thorarchaeota archaeon]|nr:hypothetical protein [Candidatus Thorarchaeota archaeon]
MTHFVSSYRVVGDFIAMTINPRTGEVISFSSELNEISYLPDVVTDASEAVAQYNQLSHSEIELECNPELAIVKPSQKYASNVFRMAWVLTEKNTGNEHWMDAYQNEYIGNDLLLSYGSSHEMGMDFYSVTDPQPHDPQWGYMAADAIHDRMSHNNYDSLLEYNTVALGLTAALATRDVVFFVGHGQWYTYLGGIGPNYLCCGDEPLYAPQWFSWVNLPASVSTDLFFVIACGGGLWGPNTVAYHAILRGCGCYIGWADDVSTSGAMDAAMYFFDYAVNGKTFTQSIVYARAKTGMLQNFFVLHGDGDLALTAYDTAPSFSYSSQRYTHYVGDTGWGYTVASEPLWGLDVDAFRVTVVGDHDVDIVAYVSSECKVKMEVYYWKSGSYWYRIRSGSSSSPGASVTESVSYTSTREYLIVFTQTDGHGGWYTFNFNELS